MKKVKRGRISTSRFNPPLRVLCSSVQSKPEILGVKHESTSLGTSKEGMRGGRKRGEQSLHRPVGSSELQVMLWKRKE